MNKIIDWYKTQPDTSKAIIIFSSTIFFAIALFFLTSLQMNSQGNKAMKPYTKSQVLIDTYLDSLKKPIKLEQKYFAVFKTQQKILSLRKAHHLHLGLVFFRNYYGVLILSMVFSCIGGVVLFLIANQGWSNVSITLKSLFLALAIVVTFFGLFPAVFKQQENFEANLKNYMSYTKAELNIIDQLSKLDNPLFAAIKDTTNNPEFFWKVDSLNYYKNIDSMITKNDDAINGLTNYILNIDAKEIKSMSDVYRMVNNNNSIHLDSTQ